MEKTYSYERKIELAVLFHYGRLEAVNKVLPVITVFSCTPLRESLSVNRPRMPQTITNPPMAKKNTGYPPIASIIPPKAITTTIATTGNMASTLSAVALFFGVVMSVIHALKAESLLVEPKRS